jgi:FkbM family methyltransferase
MIKRIKILLERNIAAKTFGLPFFFGMAKFKIPEFITVKNKNYRINFPKKDIITAGQVFCEVFLEDCYNLALIKHPIKKIMDIGANMGFSSLRMSVLFNPDLLIAFEPNPDMIKYIELNLSDFPSSIIEKKAIGSKNGKANLFFVEREATIISGLTKVEVNKDGDTEIKSFAEIIEKYGPFDLVKMDCEGGEWDFINDKAWEKVNYLTMEYHLSEKHNSKQKEDLIQALEKNFILLKDHPIDLLTGMILAKSKFL